ncbi:DUF6480 family protein [Streptomyces sp. NPDC056387]|uniref:DUF6480 family protein n=1 Tax=Streptomyces sp. NPDC056387 TaxID=3345803 RepID=UPI0035D6C315
MDTNTPDPRSRAAPDFQGPVRVPPGETPPAESGTGPATGPYRPIVRGWGKGPLVLIIALAVFVALFFLAYGIMLAL